MKNEAYEKLLSDLERLQEVAQRLAGVTSHSEKTARLEHISKIVNHTADTLADYVEKFDR